MRILLCAATEMEIAPTLQALSHREGHQVKLLITGVGLMASTYALAKELATTRYDMVLQAGVAGSLDAARPLSQVVAVKNEYVGDLGVQENGSFRSLFDLKLLSPDGAPWHNGRLQNTHAVLGLTELPVVDSVTVNEVSTRKETIAYYRDHLQVQIESMEGAALHYVALLEKIPFLQIRSLSNFIGERDKARWQMKEAIAALNRELQRLLLKLDTI
ncbi:MAG TPA: futalosine hydrolase [Flavisolibacter sp.]|nr:futalosine hydrolase [Flavisolibacter sp.]